MITDTSQLGDKSLYLTYNFDFLSIVMPNKGLKDYLVNTKLTLKHSLFSEMIKTPINKGK